MRAENTKPLGRPCQYPWDEMAVGESFIVEGRTSSSFSGSMAHANNTRAPKRWKLRTDGANLEIRRVK